MRPVQVFISYRRDDSAGYARAIYDALALQFGDDRVFIDVDDIGAGQAFDEVIAQAVGQSEVLLVLIGRRWLGEAGGAASRLHQPGDFVRREVASALAKGMRVVPLLLDGATMPSADQLPEAIRALATRHALAIDNTRFASDMQRLVAQLRGWLGEVGPAPPVTAAAAPAPAPAPVSGPGFSPRPGPRRRGLLIGSVAAAATAALAGAWWAQRPPATAGADHAAHATRALVNGLWLAEVAYDWPGANPSERFEFSGAGEALQGTASFLRVPRGIQDGSVRGTQLRFETQSIEQLGDQQRVLVHHYQAELLGDALAGQMQTEGGSSAHGPVRFTARRSAGP